MGGKENTHVNKIKERGAKTELDKATLKCFAVYSAHPSGFLAYWDKKYKNI